MEHELNELFNRFDKFNDKLVSLTTVLALYNDFLENRNYDPEVRFQVAQFVLNELAALKEEKNETRTTISTDPHLPEVQ